MQAVVLPRLEVQRCPIPRSFLRRSCTSLESASPTLFPFSLTLFLRRRHSILNAVTMQTIHRFLSSTRRVATADLRHENRHHFAPSRIFSTSGSNDGGGAFDNDIGWDTHSSWSTGIAKDHFNGEAIDRRRELADLQETEDKLRELEVENRKSKAYVDGWKQRMSETCVLLKQVQEPGARGSYLKDSEKAEMYRLHKQNPEVYTVEKLAKDYRIMRQRVHAILWLKELEEEEEKKLGHPLDDSVELLLDTFPEFFISHDREFHVASLPYKPDFKVMPEGWDGITKDLDEVHYEISKKEDEMLYREFVEKMNFNKKKMAGEVKCHRYSRRRPSDGWTYTVEKMGPRGKRGGGGGWKFASMPDGSTRPLNEMEKMYVRRETPRRRRRILP